jgi:ribosomal protein L16/L10AE
MRPRPTLPVPPLGARLGCGCRVAFRPGVDGSPVTVVLQAKADTCAMAIHVVGLPLYDHREALRRATRQLPEPQPDFEEEG